MFGDFLAFRDLLLPDDVKFDVQATDDDDVSWLSKLIGLNLHSFGPERDRSRTDESVRASHDLTMWRLAWIWNALWWSSGSARLIDRRLAKRGALPLFIALSLYLSFTRTRSLSLSLSVSLWLARTHTTPLPLFLRLSLFLARRCCCLCKFLHPLRIVDCYRQCRVSLSAISCTPITKLKTCSLFSQAMHSLPVSLSLCHSGWGSLFLTQAVCWAGALICLPVFVGIGIGIDVKCIYSAHCAIIRLRLRRRPGPRRRRRQRQRRSWAEYVVALLLCVVVCWASCSYLSYTRTHVLKALAGLSLFVYLFVGLFACCSLWFDCLMFSSSCSFSCSLVSLWFSLLLFIWQLCALIAVVVAPLIAQSESRHHSGAVTVTVSGAVTVTYISHRTHSWLQLCLFSGRTLLVVSQPNWKRTLCVLQAPHEASLWRALCLVPRRVSSCHSWVTVVPICGMMIFIKLTHTIIIIQ